MIVMQRFVKAQQPLCRDCGRSITLRYTGMTLWQGWWGVISFFANCFVLLANAATWVRYSRVPSPSSSFSAASVPLGVEPTV